ncbi:MAG: hypothetical protein JNK05_16025 [Myxococcales bacterium]|nr:hypothetical protein [Myxococcales bacterium]
MNRAIEAQRFGVRAGLLALALAGCSTPTPAVDSAVDAATDRPTTDGPPADQSSDSGVDAQTIDVVEMDNPSPDVTEPDVVPIDVIAPDVPLMCGAIPMMACGGECVDIFTNSAHCGACNVPCGSGQVCMGGVCMMPCPAGQARCAGACVDTSSSSAHCGMCGRMCGASERCVAGSCAITCPAGQTQCGASCVDTNTSAMNCGVCGRTCAASERCAMGACQPLCPSGQTMCGASCVDTNSNALHCGRCGNMCPAGQFCSAGTCSARCDPPTTNCSNVCVNLMSADTNNCGACGRVCAGGANATAVCTTGTCGLTCSAGFGDCDSNAANGCETNTAANVMNCGTCGTVCTAGPNQAARCVAGGCTRSCNAGFGDCDGDPSNGCETNLLTSALHCGRCANVCPAAAGGSATCSAGSCSRACPSGRSECTAGGVLACVDYQSDAANCGGCGNACPSGQSCVTGACRALCSMGQTACGASMTCVDLQSNNMNCGECGRACPAGATCTRGACLEPFRIASLSSTGCATGDALLSTALQDPPVAGTSLLVGYSGWTLARNFTTLAGPPSLVEPHDLIISELRGNAWILGDDSGPISRGTGARTITMLWSPQQGGKLKYDRARRLSRAIPIDTNGNSTQQAIYSGHSRFAVHTDQFYEIDVDTGAVTVLAYMGMPIPQPVRASSPHFVTSGILEHSGASRWIVYVQNQRTIARMSLSNLATTVVGNYNIGFGLGDAAHLALSPDGTRWFFRWEGPSVLGNLAEGFANCPATTFVSAAGVSITSLSTVGCSILNTLTVAGDDRGPIAVDWAYAYLTGAEATMSVNANPASFNNTTVARVGPYTGHLVSNLADGALYGLHTGPVPLPVGDPGAGMISFDRLVPYSSTTGRPSGAAILLSRSVPMDRSTVSVIASGWNRMMIVSANRAWNIELPSGRVTDFGIVALPALSSVDRIARGVVEAQGASTSLVFVENSTSVSRLVLGGALTRVGSFSNLGNAWSIDVSPANMRWVTGSQAIWQFGPNPNQIASCPMTFTR